MNNNKQSRLRGAKYFIVLAGKRGVLSVLVKRQRREKQTFHI